MVERHRERHLVEDFRAGQVCSIVANAMGGSHQRVFKPGDFFPSLRALESEPEGLSAEAARARMLTFGAQVTGYEQRRGNKKRAVNDRA